MEIVSCHIVSVYLDEQFASETELDEEPEEHASKHHFQHVAKAPDPCVSSVLNLESTTTVHVLSSIQNFTCCEALPSGVILSFDDPLQSRLNSIKVVIHWSTCIITRCFYSLLVSRVIKVFKN